MPEKSDRKMDQKAKRVGIDQAGESERRYHDIPVAARGDSEVRERENDYQDKNKKKQRVSDVEDEPGHGSKTEGAFGKEHENLDERMNTRYRRKDSFKP